LILKKIFRGAETFRAAFALLGCASKIKKMKFCQIGL